MHVWDYRDTLALILVICIPIFAGGLGLWLAGYTILKQRAKSKGMTYSEYVDHYEKVRQRR